MSRLFLSRALSASGVMGATLAIVASYAGIVGVVISTPQFCPESLSAARCRAAGSKAALIAAYGLIGAGAAGGLLMAGQLTDPEA